MFMMAVNSVTRQTAIRESSCNLQVFCACWQIVCEACVVCEAWNVGAAIHSMCCAVMCRVVLQLARWSSLCP